jgi:hypothetical protein
MYSSIAYHYKGIIQFHLKPAFIYFPAANSPGPFFKFTVYASSQSYYRRVIEFHQIAFTGVEHLEYRKGGVGYTPLTAGGKGAGYGFHSLIYICALCQHSAYYLAGEGRQYICLYPAAKAVRQHNYYRIIISD